MSSATTRRRQPTLKELEDDFFRLVEEIGRKARESLTVAPVDQHRLISRANKAGIGLSSVCALVMRAGVTPEKLNQNLVPYIKKGARS